MYHWLNLRNLPTCCATDERSALVYAALKRHVRSHLDPTECVLRESAEEYIRGEVELAYDFVFSHNLHTPMELADSLVRREFLFGIHLEGRFESFEGVMKSVVVELMTTELLEEMQRAAANSV